jgi:tRNA pseudouridine55 synthase
MTILSNEPEVMNGVLLLNKPTGISSNAALQRAKRLFGVKKAGHSGSLDPLATGMLPICFNEATKVCQYLLDADKCYETTAVLGIKTNTADATGEVISKTEHFVITEAMLQEAISKYIGTTQQVPSMFSALKHKGQPLYRYARLGIDILRPARDIHISELVLTQFNDKEYSLTVTCGKGTYIRNLVEDIGDALGVGAHVSQLHRVYTSGFEHQPMYTLEALEAMSSVERIACLIPMDEAVSHIPSITLDNIDVTTLRQGRRVEKVLPPNAELCVRLYDEDSRFIGFGESVIKGELRAKRLMSFES